MKAMILSAGYGKRLRPLTENCPKPLIKIGNETLLSNTLIFLKEYGIKEIIINVHYLANQIINYIKKKNLGLSIKIIKEEQNILDTGGGILNVIKNFSDDAFLVINPDTIWSKNYLEELKMMENYFFENKSKCILLLVNKTKSFDQNFKGDFNLEKNLANRDNKENLKYVYTGLQIIKPEIFKNFNKKIFSINEVWDGLIKNKELVGFESKNKFLHVSTLSIYKSILKKNLNVN